MRIINHRYCEVSIKVKNDVYGLESDIPSFDLQGGITNKYYSPYFKSKRIVVYNIKREIVMAHLGISSILRSMFYVSIK